jgi:hypothetical protein
MVSIIDYCHDLHLGLTTKVRAWKNVGWKCNMGVTFAFLGVQVSVRKWARILSNGLALWELESWWTPKSLESDLKGQNSLDWKNIYTIKKSLKFRCLKWAHMIHLCAYNTCYGKKEGQKSKCQFGFWPLKINNRPKKILMRATTLISTSLQLKVYTISYGPSKWQEFQFREFWDSQLESPRKNDIWISPCGKS